MVVRRRASWTCASLEASGEAVPSLCLLAWSRVKVIDRRPAVST